MKKKNFLAFGLVSISLFSCLASAGCKPNNDSSGEENKPAAVICDMLAQNTDYTVVIPSDYTRTEEYSAKQICSYFEEVTGETISYQSFKKQWLTENTDCGLEVQAARIGGLIQRTKDCKERLQQWADGAIEKISQLNDEILDFGGERPNEGKGLSVVYNSYKGNYTVNY